MNFAQFSFWCFLIGGILFILLIRRIFSCWIKDARTFDRLSLCLLNMGLLFSESRLTLVIFMSVLVITYLTLLWLRRVNVVGAWKHVLLGGLILVQFLPLLYYKYGCFIAVDVFHVQGDLDFLKVVLIPTGLSFYTFQMVSFVLDYAKDHERFPSFLDYCNFAGFFPQIVAGPIERRDQLLPQIEDFRWKFSWENLWSGLRWVVIGFFFKLSLAENIAGFSGWCDEPSQNPYLIWYGSALFGLRIYYDFAGYSLIAVGLGKMLGIRLEINFWSPYTAKNIQEFWRRWHRTLSGWFRDYIYFPMGGGRSRFWVLNILIVFVVSGIWHGAGYNFIMWGMIHGILLVVHRAFHKLLALFPPFITWAGTMVFVVLTWLFFYQTDWSVLVDKLDALVRVENYSLVHVWEAADELGYATGFGALFWSVLGIIQIGVEFLGLKKFGNPYHFYRPLPVMMGLVILIVFTAPVVQNGFIYFNF